MTKDIKANTEATEEDDIEKLVENELSDMTNTSADNVYRLKKPILYNGEEVSEFSFDFDKLTGADALNIEEQLASCGKTIYAGAINDANYLILMAAKACTKPLGVDFFKRIGIADFERIKNRARFFLMGLSR